MNREILFKAKRKDNGEWVEGYYCKTTIGNDVRPSDVIFVPFKVSRNEMCIRDRLYMVSARNIALLHFTKLKMGRLV